LDHQTKTTKPLILEGAVSIFMVLLFFGVFLVFLNRLFPSGILYDSIMKNIAPANSIDRIHRDRMIRLSHKNGSIDDLGNKMAAVLETKINQVKGKRANDVAWKKVWPGMPLFDHDAVQTYNRSGAIIKFDQDNIIEMNENSLIVIKKLEEDIVFRERRSFIVVADGEFRGKFFSTPGKPVFVEISTPTGVARIKPSHSSDEPVDFKVRINPDSSSTFIVYSGKAEVEAQGQTVELSSLQKTLVSINMPPLQPMALPAPVRLKSPANEKLFLFSKLPPEVSFNWAPTSKAAGYIFEISDSPLFEEIFLQTTTASNNFTAGHLQNGNYYWRVATIEGFDDDIFSNPRKISIKQDTTPPDLTVSFPVDIVKHRTTVIDGKTDPDAILYINNRRVALSGSGSFSHQQKLKAGINVIVVESMDQVGNSTYQSKHINAKYYEQDEGHDNANTD
jgi:hypothetical protein